MLDKSRAETMTKPVILIADTSPSILHLLEATFQLHNFTVFTATSARQCLAIYNGLMDVIDIVLMDGTIAGEQGIEVIINIKRIKRDQKIIVVVEEENMKARAMRLGANVVIMKPISADNVLAKVNDMLLSEQSFKDKKKAIFARRG